VGINLMYRNLKRHHLTSDSMFGSIVMVAVLIACCAALLQCNEGDLDGREPAASDVPRSIIRNGYKIQLFSSPEEQLRHARAWFSDPLQKRAALEVLIDSFPDAGKVRAEAELELAYLTLGSDYRFATPAQCRAAISQYKQILSDFSDLPFICAKANWYIGWILADLLHERRNAAAYFQTVIDQYPDTALNLKPPVPWVSLVLPQIADRPQAVYERPTYYWGSIALLELVRISEAEADKWSAFQKLYSDYRSRQATGYAIHELLKGPPSLAQKTVPYAKNHLDAMLFSRPLAKEIRGLLKNAELPHQKLRHGRNRGTE